MDCFEGGVGKAGFVAEFVVGGLKEGEEECRENEEKEGEHCGDGDSVEGGVMV